MRVHAAVVRSAPGQYELVEVELEAPRASEVLVRMVAAGLCHTDDHVAKGDLTAETYPMCGGHEGAGIVEAVGPEVTGIRAGDHVVLAYLAICGRCRWCSTGHQNLCDLGATTMIGSRLDDPSSFRMHLDGQPVGQLAGVGTFAEYSTVDARQVIVIDRSIPLTSAALAGCCVVTGWGSAVRAADVRPGDTVIVMGVGGVGINAVQGAAVAGARDVIAVDPVAFKRSTAMSLGATIAFADIREAAEYGRSRTNGQGADSAIVSVGVTTGEHLATAVEAVGKKGVVVAAGIGSTTVGIPINPTHLTTYEKRIQGAIFGHGNPLVDIPKVLDLYQDGSLKIDEIVTATYPLGEINSGFNAMHEGANIRGVITF